MPGAPDQRSNRSPLELGRARSWSFLRFENGSIGVDRGAQIETPTREIVRGLAVGTLIFCI
jgi:hypothetical protein